MAVSCFGYGSLINSKSLQASVPSAKPRPAYIKGFRRCFNLWNPAGFTTTNLDVTGIPFCALDVSKLEDGGTRVNGVAFELDNASFEAMQVREAEYKLIITTCYDYNSDESLGECFVYSAGKNNGVFDQENEAQQRYLQICLDGAKEYGDTFYQEFVRNTFINGKPIKDRI